LNPEPTDYAYYYGFRRAPLEEQEEFCSLDFLFALSVCRQVSTPSTPEAAGLGSGLPYRFRNLGFPEFDRFYKHT
jgi:hypothetical protein